MISKEYLAQLQHVFQDKTRPNGFGGKVKKLGEFHNFMNRWKPKTLLDYGCGKGIILNHLRETYLEVSIDGYDPAVPMFSSLPKKKYDCVFSNDVLEHIEPEFIEDVLKHICDLSINFIWLRIDTLPARKTLLDGRNAHISLHSSDWWEDKLNTNINGKIIYKSLHKGKFDVAITK